MLRPFPLRAPLPFLVLALACASTPGRAERIGTRSDGGTLMLSANNEKAWESARDLMGRHCDGGYRVLGQATQVTGVRAGPPPTTPGAMGDPLGAAGTAYGLRVDYECTRSVGLAPTEPGTVPDPTTAIPAPPAMPVVPTLPPARD